MKKTAIKTTAEALRDELVAAFLESDECTDTLYWVYADMLDEVLPGDGDNIEGNCDAVTMRINGEIATVTAYGLITADDGETWLPPRVADALALRIHDDCDFERSYN